MNLTEEELIRKQEFDALMSSVPDEPRGERIKLAASWMCSSPSTVYIWSAPNARKAPSTTKIALLRSEMQRRGLIADA